MTLPRSRWWSLCAVFLLLVALPLMSFAQMARVQFDRLSVTDGLSQVSAYAIHQDTDGFIWIGTDDGLNRFDGYDFQVFLNEPTDSTSLSFNTINAIYEDAKGWLWVGTDQGLNRLDRKTGKFKTFRFDFHDETTISNNTVWCITEDGKGRLWVGTNNGLNRFDYETETFYRYKQRIEDKSSLSNNNVNCLFTDSIGELWVGTNQGLNLWDEVTDQFYRIPFISERSSAAKVINSITVSKDDRLLVATNRGVLKLTEDGLAPSVYSRLKDRLIQTILSDSMGDIWFGTSDGLYQYIAQRRRMVRHLNQSSNGQSISNNNIVSLYQDDTGIIWIGTFGGGVNVFYREQQQVFHHDRTDLGVEDLPSNNVFCLEEVAHGHYWLGTNAGLGQFEDAQNASEEIIERPRDLPMESIRAIEQLPDGRVAIGYNRGGLVIYDPAAEDEEERYRYFLHDPENDNSITDDRISDIMYAHGKIWLGTQGRGVSIVDLGSGVVDRLTFNPSDQDGLRDNRITALASEPGAVWIGTASTGAYRYDLGLKTFVNYRNRADSSRYLSHDHVLSLASENGNIWVGTRGGGLNRISTESSLTTVFTSTDGLANNVVYGIVSDGTGRLWMTTNKGVTVLDVENQNFINYTDSDGLGNQSFNSGAALLSSTDEVVFGGLQGIDRIRFRELQQNTIKPPVFFTQVEAFDKRSNEYDSKLSRTLLHRLDTLTLDPDISLVTLGFSALNYRQAEKNQYAYRLKGQSDEWTYVGDRRYVTFSGLAPGGYALEVRAANNNGIWTDTPAKLFLNVIPAFYQTGLFKLLVALGILVLAYFLYMYRVKNLNTVNKMLEEKVDIRTKQIAKERDDKVILLQEIHHRVKNNLQVINSLLRLQSHYVKDNEALWALNESQNRVMSMAMIHEKMYKTENLADISLREYVSELCREIIATYALTNNVSLDLDIQEGNFSIDTLTPLGLIMNEVITNSMKYAFPEGQAGTLKVHLNSAEEPGKYRLVIGDDGVGMPIKLDDEESDSLGTTLISSLTDQLNGTISRLDGTGTVYELIFEDIHTGNLKESN